MLLYWCDTEKIYVDPEHVIDGAGVYEGQKVHLVDSGPAHSDLIAHPIKVEQDNAQLRPQ